MAPVPPVSDLMLLQRSGSQSILPSLGAANPNPEPASLLNPTFVLMSVASFFFFACSYLLIPLMPLYFHNHLGLNGALMGALLASFSISSLLLRPWAGKWADEKPGKTLMLLGIALYLTCNLLYQAHNAVVWLFAVRIVQGMGFSLFYTVSSSAITKAIPAHRRAEGLSYYSNTIKLAMGLSPVVATMLATQQAYHTSFWLASGLALIAWLAISALPNQAPKNLTEETGLPALKGKLFNRNTLFPGLTLAANSLVFGALLPFAPMLAHESHMPHLAWFYPVYAVALIGSRFFAGKWADRLPREAVIIPGMALVIMAVALLSLLHSAVWFLPLTALYGLGAGVVQPALVAMATDRSEPQERGSAMATFTMCSDLGQAVGSFLMGALSPVLSQGYHGSLLVVSGICLLGLLGFGLKTAQRYYPPSKQPEKQSGFANQCFSNG